MYLSESKTGREFELTFELGGIYRFGRHRIIMLNLYMTTFTLNTEDQKVEKAVKAFLDALELKYDVNYSSGPSVEITRPLSKKEQKVYNGLKNALQEIREWENGELELKDARDFLNEL